MNIYAHIYVNTRWQSTWHSSIHMYTYAYIYTNVHTYIPTCTFTCTYQVAIDKTFKYIYVHICIHIYKYTYPHFICTFTHIFNIHTRWQSTRHSRSTRPARATNTSRLVNPLARCSTRSRFSNTPQWGFGNQPKPGTNSNLRVSNLYLGETVIAKWTDSTRTESQNLQKRDIELCWIWTFLSMSKGRQYATILLTKCCTVKESYGLFPQTSTNDQWIGLRGSD